MLKEFIPSPAIVDSLPYARADMVPINSELELKYIPTLIDQATDITYDIPDGYYDLFEDAIKVAEVFKIKILQNRKENKTVNLLNLNIHDNSPSSI